LRVLVESALRPHTAASAIAEGWNAGAVPSPPGRALQLEVWLDLSSTRQARCQRAASPLPNSRTINGALLIGASMLHGYIGHNESVAKALVEWSWSRRLFPSTI